MLTRLCVYLSLGGLACLPAAAQVLVYSANQNAGTISLIDPETSSVAASPSTGQSTATSLAITPDGSRVYVASGNGGGEGQTGGSIVVLDTATNVLATLSVNNPFWIALNSTGSRAYFTNSLSDGTGFVSVIDTIGPPSAGVQAAGASKITVTASIPVGHRPLGIALSPNGDNAYVANATDNTVSVIDTLSSTVIATIPVPTFPWGVAVTPDGHHVYISSQSANTVSVVDTSTNAVTQTISVGSPPLGVAINPSGTRAYVALSTANSVAVIDTTTNSVIASVPVGTYPIGVTVAPPGDRVYVANEQASSVSVIDTASNAQVATIALVGGSFPFGIASSPPPQSGSNVPLLTGGNTFSGNQSVSGSVTATSFSGDGSNLTNLSPVNLAPGTAAISISGNAATSSSAANATNATNSVNAANAVNSANLGGVAASSYARLDIGNSFNGSQTVTGNIAATGSLSATGNISATGSVTIGDGTPITLYVSSTFSLALPSMKPSTCIDVPENLAAATGPNDTIALGIPNSFLSAGGFLIFQARESAAGQITIRICNLDPNGPASKAVTDTMRVDLLRH